MDEQEMQAIEAQIDHDISVELRRAISRIKREYNIDDAKVRSLLPFELGGDYVHESVSEEL